MGLLDHERELSIVAKMLHEAGLHSRDYFARGQISITGIDSDKIKIKQLPYLISKNAFIETRDGEVYRFNYGLDIILELHLSQSDFVSKIITAYVECIESNPIYGDNKDQDLYDQHDDT